MRGVVFLLVVSLATVGSFFLWRLLEVPAPDQSALSSARHMSDATAPRHPASDVTPSVEGKAGSENEALALSASLPGRLGLLAALVGIESHSRTPARLARANDVERSTR